MTRDPRLDVLRVVAVSAVVLGHASGWHRPAHVGVDVFFVLSGYLVGNLALRLSWRDLPRFAVRRARRLLPAAWTVAALTGAPWGAWLLWHADPGPWLHWWSLRVEVVGYAVVALAACAAGRRGVLVLAAVSLVGYATSYLDTSGAWYYAPTTRLYGITAGAALAATGLRLSASPALCAAGIAAAVALPQIQGSLLATLSTAALVASWRWDGAVPAFVGWLASRSYSLYLWHAVLLGWYGLPGLVASFALTEATYRLVEVRASGR